MGFDGEDGGEVVSDSLPGVAGVGGAVDLAACCAEVDAAVVEGVYGHGVAEDVDVAVLLREAARERLPVVAAGAAAEDLQLAVEGEVFGVALDGDDVNGLGLVGVDVDDEAEVGREIAGDFGPVVAGVVGAHDVPVFLHEEGVGGGWVHGDVVDAVADFGGGVGNVFAVEALVDGLPGEAGVVAAEGSGGGDGDDDAVGVGGVKNDGVEAEAAGTGVPLGAGFGGAEAGEFVPGGAAVGGLE